MTQYVLSLSYGKDSLACLGAIEKLGLPLDRIIHAEVWATDTIPADLPPMVEFKKKADAIIKERWGITVEHIYATNAATAVRPSEKRRSPARDGGAKRRRQKMEKLIDADALKQELIDKGFYPAIVRRTIERAPGVDAVPVMHGRWIKRPDERICPFCEHRHGYFGGKDLNYCPNCGARMDVERR